MCNKCVWAIKVDNKILCPFRRALKRMGGKLLIKTIKRMVIHMNSVEPIRDIERVYDIAEYLEARNQRDYVLFILGIYSGLRISDLLQMRVRDVHDGFIYLREKKTGKEKKIEIHKDIKNILEEYMAHKKSFEFLFKSRKGLNQPITRQRAYGILKDAAGAFGLRMIGTHTLRKTFGYHLYQQTKDAAMIKEILNHNDISTTLIYIGINQDRMNSAVRQLSFMARKKRKQI